MKLIDKRGQIKDISESILDSEYKEHYIVEEKGLLYLTDKEDFEKGIEEKRYNGVGYIKSDNKTYKEIRQELIALIEECTSI